MKPSFVKRSRGSHGNGSGLHATFKCSFGEELPCFTKMKDIGLELGWSGDDFL